MKIALAGNPNSGKTSLFNLLTGLRQKVGNFPGVTVDRKSGTFLLEGEKQARLIDLPGAYSLYPQSDDEMITARVLRDPTDPDHPDLCIYVADGTNLKRSLLLCTQIMDLGIPLVLAVNMTDLMGKSGFNIEASDLEKNLDIPAIKISALKGEGLKTLKQRVNEVVRSLGAKSETEPDLMGKEGERSFFKLPDSFLPVLQKTQLHFNCRNAYNAWQLLLDPIRHLSKERVVDLQALRVEGGMTQEGSDPRIKSETANAHIKNELTVRFENLQTLLGDILARKQEPGMAFTNQLDKVLLHPVWGYFIFFLIMAAVFQAIFSWAVIPMNAIDIGFGALGSVFKQILPEGLISDMLVDGLWSGLGGIAVFIPQIAFLFMFISLMEDTGYMSRAVFLMDRIMRPFGFSGKSVIPLIGGMACAVPSIMMTRSIPHRLERLITIMVTPLMSCSARIPVYTLLIGLMVPATKIGGLFNLQGLVMLSMYLLGFVMSLLVAWVFKIALKYKGEGVFVTELPVFRSPRWKNTGLTIYHKCRTFVVEAGRIILVVSLILWFLASFGPGEQMAKIEEDYTARLQTPDLAGEEIQKIELQRKSTLIKASYAGIIGQFIEPVIRPLGFDWKLGIALLTSFAAREVFVGSMATIYGVGDAEEGNYEGLRFRMQSEINDDGTPVYGFAVALSLLIFYAFAMQCMSTLAIVKRETGSWKWTMIMLVYMTGLAYFSSFVVYSIVS